MGASDVRTADAPTEVATPGWTLVAPMLALMLGGAGELAWHGDLPSLLLVAAVPILFAAVFATVHHAETIAHRIGQPFGSIVLALAVTFIEVSLIVSVLLASADGESAVARDTVFAAMMIVLNGIVGLSLLVGGIRHHSQNFRSASAAAALGVLGALAVLCLVLPNYTVATPGPVYSPVQLTFVATVSLLLYGLFLYVQLARHSEDFMDIPFHGDVADARSHEVGKAEMRVACITLPVALLGVVLLAETLAGAVERGIAQAGLPEALVGIAIAMVVLMPEGIASLRAARANRMQTSLNLALGSALASLCLTIPTVAIVSLALGRTLVLGLDGELTVLLVLTLFMSSITLTTGRTTVLQGGLHLVIFAAFLILAAEP
ncbi:MAG: calcium:proton antiporter [Erythrobacter sp.]